MADLSLPSIATGASLAGVISTLGTWRTNLHSKTNDGLVGGAAASGNNIKEDTVYRINMRDETKTNTFFGEVFQEDMEIRAVGGTVAKVSGLVFSVSDATWYIHQSSSDPDQGRRIRKTTIANDSVIANRDTYLDIGIDETIDKNAVTNDATAPDVAADHFRFAKIVSSASIATITMLGNTKFKNTNWGSMFGLDTVRIVMADGSASAATTLTIKSGTRVRDRADSMNISVAADVIVKITTSGANGLDTGAESASTWYAVHILGDSTGSNTPRGILSKSGTSPTLPSGWNKSRRIGWIRNDSNSHFINGDRTGLIMHYHNIGNQGTEILTNGSATSYTDVNLSTVIPSTAVMARLGLIGKGTSGGGFQLRKNGVGGTQFGYKMVVDSATDMSDYIEMPIDASRVIEYKADANDDVLDIEVLGYIDANLAG